MSPGRYALLGLLLDGPDYRYGLGNSLATRLGPTWAMNSGNLYQTSGRLERSGYIECLGARPNRSDDRAIYAITGKGAEEYERWFATDVALPPLPCRPLLLKIVLAGPERLPDVLEQIDAYERVCVERMGEIAREHDEIPTSGSPPLADHVLLRLALSSDIAYLEGELKWARHAREVAHALRDGDIVWPRASRRGPPAGEGVRSELFDRMARGRGEAAG